MIAERKILRSENNTCACS